MRNADLAACEEFHGLRARPFSLTPDLRFTYHSRSHTRAVEQISQALKRREGLVVVTGEVGTGKTMLCRALLETFQARTFLSVILDPLLTVEDLLYQVLTDFGLVSMTDRPGTRPPVSEVGRHDLVATLHKFLASLIPLDAHAVIMIDEAQHLTGPVLEQVRLLSNFETDTAKLLQIVLVGQPNLDIVLERPDMRQLNQRVARRFELEPLTATEVSDYVERRLLVARQAPPDGRGATVAEPAVLDDGQTMVQFTPTAMSMVAGVSRGIPRLVNTLCDRALEASFERREHTVDRKAVRLAAARLRLPVPRSAVVSRWLRVAAAAVVVAAVALGALWWMAARAPAAPATTPAAAPPATPQATPPVRPAASMEPSAPPPVLPPASSAPSSAASFALSSGPPAEVAPGGARYEITAASFRTEERATAAAAALARSGLPVSARIDSTSQWYRVIVGPFASADEARAAQETLEGQGFPGSRVSGP